jgi:hypothetical protein
MTAKSEVRKFLEVASDTEIRITYLPGGGARVDFAPHADTHEDIIRWKEALSEAEGMWADREDIEEEMKTIRKELDRSFPEQYDAKAS